MSNTQLYLNNDQRNAAFLRNTFETSNDQHGDAVLSFTESKDKIFTNNDLPIPPVFKFKPKHGRIDWRQLMNSDLQSIISTVDVQKLEKLLSNVTYADIDMEDRNQLGDAHFVKLFKLGQISVEYLTITQDYFEKVAVDLDSHYQKSRSECLKTQEQIALQKKANSTLKQELKIKQKTLSTYDYLLKLPTQQDQQSFKCQFCHKQFISKKFLQQHCLRNHPQEKIHQEVPPSGMSEVDIKIQQDQLLLKLKIELDQQLKTHLRNVENEILQVKHNNDAQRSMQMVDQFKSEIDQMMQGQNTQMRQFVNDAVRNALQYRSVNAELSSDQQQLLEQKLQEIQQELQLKETQYQEQKQRDELEILELIKIKQQQQEQIKNDQKQLLQMDQLRRELAIQKQLAEERQRQSQDEINKVKQLSNQQLEQVQMELKRRQEIEIEHKTDSEKYEMLKSQQQEEVKKLLQEIARRDEEVKQIKEQIEIDEKLKLEMELEQQKKMSESQEIILKKAVQEAVEQAKNEQAIKQKEIEMRAVEMEKKLRQAEEEQEKIRKSLEDEAAEKLEQMRKEVAEKQMQAEIELREKRELKERLQRERQAAQQKEDEIRKALEEKQKLESQLKAKSEADLKAKIEQARLQIEEEEKKEGPIISSENSLDVVDPPVVDKRMINEIEVGKEPQLPTGGVTPKKTNKTMTNTETGSKSYYYDDTEKSESRKQESEHKPAKPKAIDPEVWKNARVKLKSLLENFGQSKYQSNNCTIRSLFEHGKDKVNSGKQKVIKDMKEELSDMTVELLNILKLSGKKIEYSPWQQQQQSIIVEEIKFLSKKDLGEFATMLSKQRNDPDLRHYLEHIDRCVLKKMHQLRQK